LFLLLFSLSGFLHVFISKENSYDFALDGKGGGLIGYKISDLISSGISRFGAGLFLLLTLLGSFFLVFNISFEKIFDFVSNSPFLSALLDKAKVLFSKKSLDEADMEIETGTSMIMEGDIKDVEVGSSNKDFQPEQVPIFEVVQSPSEPQGAFGAQKIGSLAPGARVKPDIPSDKIWNYPPTSLLNTPPPRTIDTSEIDRRIKIIKETLKASGVDVEISPEDVKVGPTVTQYAIKPKSPTYISKIVSLHKSLALALASPNGEVRIEAPIPGKSLIGIEVPNSKRTLVYFKSLIESPAIKNMKSKLAIVLGEDVAGRPMAWDISKMPHMLIAGSTGSGKSVFIHSLLSSLLFRATPQEVKFIVIDPKAVELKEYEDIPHLLAPVVTDMDKTASVFMWAVDEMEKRYKLFEQARAKNIDDYNEKSGIQVMPYIVIVVDEFGDIMIRDPARTEQNVIRLAQKGRAAGVHLILATQRPSADAITGLIRANITCRVAFRVQNQVESRVIIGMSGAEKLIKNGDMLFLPPDASNPTRIQAALITTEETANLTKYLRNQALEPDYEEDIFEMSVPSSKGDIVKSSWGDDVEDELFDEAVSIVYSADKASASLLQRKLRVGFARASRLIDMMEERGIIGGEVSGSRGREVLIDNLPGESDLEEASGFDAEDFAGENFPRNQRDLED
jgi:S-DNA-T family DNA segregation ATPase FtsK/SpoIIIE